MMSENDFYKVRLNWYQNKYWDDPDYSGRNGFAEYPSRQYNFFVKVISSMPNKSELRILDLGCGNGSLLSHLRNNLKSKVIPFGIDFLEKSIIEAKTFLHPDCPENFICANIVNHQIDQEFDIIILDPYLLKDSDFAEYYSSNLLYSSAIKILYAYQDVLEGLSLSSFEDYPCLKLFPFSFIKCESVSIAKSN
jgi:SAM-dependent methyltransferase